MSEIINIKKFLEEQIPLIDKTIEKYIPKKHDHDSMEFSFGQPIYKYNVEAVNKAITDPLWDMLNRGGKRWRPALFLLVAEALGAEMKKVNDFLIIPEVIHNGTLLHDDIQDRSTERRGQPCTHIKFGTDIAINTGDAMFFLPLTILKKNRNNFSEKILLKAYEVYAEEMNNVSIGQATDIAWHNGLANADNISEEEYLQMCLNKTGCLARMSARLAAALAGATDEKIELIGKLAGTIGVAFQIQDDILNITESELSKKKGGIGEDITEGKRTLMAIHAMKKANEDDKKRLIEILNMHTTDQKLRNEAIEILKKHGSVEYAKERARKMVNEAWEKAEKIFPESEAKEKIKAFVEFLVEREK